ncbi:MAG: OmpA family protein [Polyangia bacterium]
MCALAAPAAAQTTNRGFQVNRYEPTTVGEWSFSVDHPWYSSTRYFAAGITLNYGHNPLVFGLRAADGSFSMQGTVLEHQLLGHVDLAGSFLDRVLISATLPITLLERGTELYGIAPVSGVAVGDPRLGVKVRLFGQPYRGPISMSLGADVWIPINTFSDPPPFPAQVGESGVRVLPKLILGGLAKSLLWSFTGGFYYRPTSAIGQLPDGSGNSVGPELQLGAALAYANYEKRFSIGPEAILHTVVTDGRAFKADSTSLEVLLGIHYNIARVIQLSVGGGVGILREPGTPDGRALFRLAYAPIREEKPKDRDGDGIPDRSDACIDEPGEPSSDPRKHGCPPPPKDSDGDGVIDPQDRCPTEAMGKTPDPDKVGCPLRDKDGDGIYDADDRCVDEPAGPNPDPVQKGCPLRDKDGDGVFDPDDQCVDVVAGPNPDPNKKGCPDKDTDGDTVFDGYDQCKDVPAGLNPDPNKKGCPLPDRDRDLVPDPTDACPDKPGAPNPDPKKNGCPGLVETREGQIVILKQVFFATNKDTILKKSFPVLDAVASALRQLPQVKRVAIEGHTDDKGKPELNRDLSDRRAKAVMKYLVDKGVEPGRLEAKGYGPDKPIADNKTNKGRALNRRVDFVIVDPPQNKAVTAVQVVTTPNATPVLDKEPAKGKKDKKGKKGKGEAAPADAGEKPKKEKKSKKGKKAA